MSASTTRCWKALLQEIRAEPVRLEFLAAHHFGVLIQRHRRGPGVLIIFQILARQVAAGFGEHEDARHIAHPERFFHADEVLALEGLQQFRRSG